MTIQPHTLEYIYLLRTCMLEIPSHIKYLYFLCSDSFYNLSFLFCVLGNIHNFTWCVGTFSFTHNFYLSLRLKIFCRNFIISSLSPLYDFFFRSIWPQKFFSVMPPVLFLVRRSSFFSLSQIFVVFPFTVGHIAI